MVKKSSFNIHINGPQYKIILYKQSTLDAIIKLLALGSFAFGIHKNDKGKREIFFTAYGKENVRLLKEFVKNGKFKRRYISSDKRIKQTV